MLSIKFSQKAAIAMLKHCWVAKFEQTAIFCDPRLTTTIMSLKKYVYTIRRVGACELTGAVPKSIIWLRCGYIKRRIRQYDCFNLFTKIIDKIGNPSQFIILYVTYRMSHLNVKGYLLCTELTWSITGSIAVWWRNFTCIQYVKIIVVDFIVIISRFSTTTKDKEPFANNRCAVTLSSLWPFSSYNWRFPCLQS